MRWNIEELKWVMSFASWRKSVVKGKTKADKVTNSRDMRRRLGPEGSRISAPLYACLQVFTFSWESMSISQDTYWAKHGRYKDEKLTVPALQHFQEVLHKDMCEGISYYDIISGVGRWSPTLCIWIIQLLIFCKIIHFLPPHMGIYD